MVLIQYLRIVISSHSVDLVYSYWDLPPTDLESQIPPANGDDEVAEPECAQPPAVETLYEEIDPELLQALGAFDAEAAEWGEDINSDLARRWNRF